MCGGEGSGALLFANPAVETDGDFRIDNRRNLTLGASDDAGAGWSRSLTIERGFAGYSDLVERPDGTVHCVFENGEAVYRERISVVSVAGDWVRGR